MRRYDPQTTRPRRRQARRFHRDGGRAMEAALKMRRLTAGKIALFIGTGILIVFIAHGLRTGHREAVAFARAMTNLRAELERTNQADDPRYSPEELTAFARGVQSATGVDDARTLAALAHQMVAGVEIEQAKTRWISALDIEAGSGVVAEEFLRAVQAADAGSPEKLRAIAAEQFGLNLKVDEPVR